MGSDRTEHDAGDLPAATGTARELAELLGRERALRRESQRQAEEHAVLLSALRERQILLERLSALQRAIVDRTPLAEVLETLVESARDLLGDDVAVLRRAGPGNQPGAIAAFAGPDVFDRRRAASGAGGIGERARREKGVVVVDAVSGADPAAAAEFGTEAIRAGIAAPILDRGQPAGSLAVGSRDAARQYDGRDHQAVIALAEHAVLALGHATALGEAIHESMHDALTRLPNRTLFTDRLEHAVALAARAGGPVGVLLCGLDGFKAVNESLSHAAGDELLRAVARRIVGCLRPTDTVARVGGDEFAVLLEELREPGDSARAARRILDALEPAFEIKGRKLFLSASIGVAAGSDDAARLFRDADLAMYRAKRQGRGRYAISEPRLHSAVAEQLELEVDLNRAIESGELELVYQPIFSLRGGTVAGLEALVRWRHPTRGLIAAERFVPLAEHSGAIRSLGRWVLAEACRQGALWRARYPGFPGLQVGVNVSAVQLSSPAFVDEVEAALGAAQLEPAGLTLEITETALMEDIDAGAGWLADLKALGVDLAIDDFGRGYASLEYLRRFPLDNLKIDRSFIASIGTRDEDPRLLRAIIDLAEIFDLRPVGEGIEREVEVARLLGIGCDLGQGHYLSEPLPAVEADGLLLRAGLLGGPPIPSPPDDAGSTPPEAASARNRGRGAGSGGDPAAGEPG